MFITADLHTHSTASDGQYSPCELVRLAKERGLQAIALTDHDTIGGLQEAVGVGEQLGLRVIRGIEFGAREHRNLHILGYGFSSDAPHLSALCEEMRRGRDERKFRIIDFLKEKEIHISLEEVEEVAGGAVIARPHFAQVLVKRGFVATNREAFDRYLDTEEYQKIERSKPTAQTCIDLIHADGGKVSLAHPYQLKMDDAELERLVRELTGCGLDAIECHYPKHSDAQTEFYLSLAEKYGLHISGGSDFHGERVKPDTALALLNMDLSWLGISL